MRAPVNSMAVVCTAALVRFALPSWAAAAEEGAARQEGADRWIPSLSITSGVTFQRWHGTVESQICQGCTPPDPQAEPLRPSETGNAVDATPFVGAELELMTPELALPTSPRLFLGGGFAGAFGSESRLAQEGNPGELRSPLPDQAQNAADFSEQSVLGQGSLTAATMGDFVYEAHAGVAFPFEWFERPLRLKLSLSWLRFDVDARGLVSDAECQQVGNTTQCNVLRQPGFLRSIQMSDKASETFNGLGPRLDLEMDTGRFGPIGSSLFLGGGAYGILGNRTIEMSAMDSFPDTGRPGLGAATTSADWGFEIAPWIFRVAVGIRFHYLGSVGK